MAWRLHPGPGFGVIQSVVQLDCAAQTKKGFVVGCATICEFTSQHSVSYLQNLSTFIIEDDASFRDLLPGVQESVLLHGPIFHIPGRSVSDSLGIMPQSGG